MKQLFSCLLFLTCFYCYPQYGAEYNKGMEIKLNESGSKYIRILLFGQTWFQDYEGSNLNDGFSIKRARLLTYAQLNDRFMLLTHFGANGIYDQHLTSMGKSNDVTLFLHEMLLQYKVTPWLYIGGGLHNYGGISRGNGQGTINMLTLDNNRADWSTLGLSDQNISHLGVYFKGNLQRFNYRFSISDAVVNTLDGNTTTEINIGETKYLGKALLNKGKYAFSGYVDYQFLEKESNLLSYRVGTYLGAKKVFNVGAGFFHQSDALVTNYNHSLISKNAQHIALDVFYDSPIGKSSSITAYGKVQHSSMGENYLLGNVVGNGTQFSGHIGYLLPKNNIENTTDTYKNRLQPYVGYSHRNFKGLNQPASELKLGANWYIDGLNAKISAEYQHAFDQHPDHDGMFTLQAMILL